MDIMELGAIGELVGGVAVIGSLIYVGMQVRQNTQATRAQAVTTLFAAQLQGETALIGPGGAIALGRALERPTELSRDEALQVGAYLYNGLISIQHTFEMYTLGLSSEAAWRSTWMGAASRRARASAICTVDSPDPSITSASARRSRRSLDLDQRSKIFPPRAVQSMANEGRGWPWRTHRASRGSVSAVD